MNSSAPPASINQEAAFLDYVERLAKHRAGRRAVHVRLSNLRSHNRRSHHLRVAALTFDALLQNIDGAQFKLSNDDLVVICKGAGVEDIEPFVVRLRYLFSEDPLLKANDEDSAPFCEWFDLEHDYVKLRALAERMVGARAAHLADAGDGRAESQGRRDGARPLEAADLGAAQRAIARADLSGLIRRQAVCAVASGQKPQPVFFEIYTSIEAFRSTLLPGIDIHANRWLFQDLTRHLDRRVIAHLARNDDATLRQNFSLNLNVGTLLSPEFLDFDEALSTTVRRTIVIELGLFDVFADLGNFLFARNFLRERGYRFCLDGMTHLSLPLIERERLGFDLVKLFWSGELEGQLGGVDGDSLRQAAHNVGQGRLILARCDSERALEVGRTLGVMLYQGHLIDQILSQSVSREQSTQAMADAMKRHRAASRAEGRRG
ncbi:MAG: hypothetical protein ACE5GS_09760 [Kiloniellaceae bacterium]